MAYAVVELKHDTSTPRQSHNFILIDYKFGVGTYVREIISLRSNYERARLHVVQHNTASVTCLFLDSQTRFSHAPFYQLLARNIIAQKTRYGVRKIPFRMRNV